MSIDPQIHPAAREELYETIRHYAVIDSEGQGELAKAFESTFYCYADAIIARLCSTTFAAEIRVGSI